MFASDGDILVMEADGSNKRLAPSTDLEDLSPKWSPDGGRIAFLSQPVYQGD